MGVGDAREVMLDIGERDREELGEGDSGRVSMMR